MSQLSPVCSGTIMWHSNFITLFWHWTIIRDGCLLLLAWFMFLWDYKCILSWNRAKPRGNKALCFMTHQLASCANQKKKMYWVCTKLLSPYLSLPLSSDQLIKLFSLGSWFWDGDIWWTMTSRGHYFSKWVTSRGHSQRVTFRGHFWWHLVDNFC